MRAVLYLFMKMDPLYLGLGPAPSFPLQLGYAV